MKAKTSSTEAGAVSYNVPSQKLRSVYRQRVERDGLLIVSPADQSPRRRALFINVSGGVSTWEKYRNGLIPSNRLWGAVQLLEAGYEIGIADALTDFYYHRKPIPHDLRFLSSINGWLEPGDIVYCAHNTMFWLPLLKRLHLFRFHLVSLLYAREPLDHARGHSGIIALNPSAADHARRLAPKTKVAHLSWGMDLDFMPVLPFRPGPLLACGRTNRDFATLRAAAAMTKAPIRVIAHGAEEGLVWPPNVDYVPGGAGWETRLTYHALMNDFYSTSSGSLVILKEDSVDYTACGFTNLLEAMAMSRPAILTRTNANRSEIDIEGTGCGLYVPPSDPSALAIALDRIHNDPHEAKAMGERGRKLCEDHYNMDRFGRDLVRFFESL